MVGPVIEGQNSATAEKPGASRPAPAGPPVSRESPTIRTGWMSGTWKKAINQVTPGSSHQQGWRVGTAMSDPRKTYGDAIIEYQDLKYEASLRKLYQSSIVKINEADVTINLASMHRLTLHRLEKKLVTLALLYKYQLKDSEEAARLSKKTRIWTHRYKQALEDWDYIKSCSLKGKLDDPFIVTTEKVLDRKLLWEIVGNLEGNEQIRLRRNLRTDLNSLSDLDPPVDRGKIRIFGGSRVGSNKKQAFESFLQRALMAILGGFFLIGPMLLMILHQTLVTRLTTVSVCVTVFGMIMAAFLDKPFDVLSATAAYAAVMVVFVGTGGGQ